MLPAVIGTVIKVPGEALTIGKAAVTGGVPVAVGVADGADVGVLLGVLVAVRVAVFVAVAVEVLVGVRVGVGLPPTNVQVKSAVSKISDQPPATAPTLLAVSSTINKRQSPFIAVPFEPNAEVRVAVPPGPGIRYVGGGAGAVNAS